MWIVEFEPAASFLVHQSSIINHRSPLLNLEDAGNIIQ